MPTSEDHNQRIIRLLKKEAEKKKYIREYMRQYRKKQAENGIKQKQYYDIEDVKKRMRENYYKKNVVSDIKFLFI